MSTIDPHLDDVVIPPAPPVGVSFTIVLSDKCRACGKRIEVCEPRTIVPGVGPVHSHHEGGGGGGTKPVDVGCRCTPDTRCSVEGCTRTRIAKGKCESHYRSSLR